MTWYLLAALFAINSQFNPDEVRKGTAVAVDHGKFTWAVESTTEPKLYVDFDPGPPMRRDGNVWTATADLATGTSHRFHYMIEGKMFGGRTDVPAYTADSEPNPNVPQGKLSE